MDIFIILGPEALIFILILALSVTNSVGSSIQSIIPILMWIIGIINFILACKFFMDSLDEKKPKKPSTAISLFSSFVVLICTVLVFKDIYQSTLDNSLLGVLSFLLELFLAGMPWLIVMFSWLEINIGDHDDSLEIHGALIKEVIVAGILILLLLI